jgi:hypothetical protein
MTEKKPQPPKKNVPLRESDRRKQLDRGREGKALRDKPPPPPTGKIEARREKKGND